MAADIEFLSQAAVDAELLFGFRDAGLGTMAMGIGFAEVAYKRDAWDPGSKGLCEFLLRKSSKSFPSMAIVSGLGGC